MIEIITTSFFIFSSIYGGPVNTSDVKVSSNVPQIKAPVVEKTETEVPNNIGLEKKVREFFKNDPLLVDVARCESHFRQYDTDGESLRGKANSADIGLMQINEYYHAEKAKKMGLDIHTVEGNLAYAKYLYDKEGAQPWKSSSKCWAKNVASTPSTGELAVNI